MNSKQINYLMKRIDEIRNAKVHEASTKLRKIVKTPQITFGALLEGIKDGTIKPKAKAALKINSQNIETLFKIPKELHERVKNGYHYSFEKLDDKEFLDLRDNIHEEAQRTKDELMLGDEENAMRLLKSFKNRKIDSVSRRKKK